MKPHLEESFALICFQRLSHHDVANLRAAGATAEPPEVMSPRSSRTKGEPSQVSTTVTDRDRTVSRRSEPSSRAILISEQLNPWEMLLPQDMTSRHRGAKPLRLCGLSEAISLLSPE